MKRPSATFYILTFVFWYLIGLDLIWSGLLSLVGSVLLRLFVFEKHGKHDVSDQKKLAVVITGTSSGFGKGIALQLAQKNITVFACVRKTEHGEALRKAAGSQKKYIIPVILDVSKPQLIDEAVKFVDILVRENNLSLFGLVNNAGIQHMGAIETVSMEQMRYTYEVNVFGVVAVTQAFGPLLREHASSSINSRVVITGSVAGLISLPYSGVYTSSKHAVESIADCLRVEFAPWNISVTLIEPGAFKTEIVSTFINQGKRDIETAETAIEKKHARLAYGMTKFSEEKVIPSVPPPQPVVDGIEYALLARFPPARMLIGYDAWFVYALQGLLLPDSVGTVLQQLFAKFLETDK